MKNKSKNILKKLIIIFLCIIFVLAAATGIFLAAYTPTLNLDFSQKTGEVTSGASGYLYGIAEDGVPSSAMCESIDISSVSQKVTGGLQHPIGDIDNVYKSLDKTDYNVVYLQDIYDTWYYLYDDIMQQRKDGTYDWQKLLDKDYLPKVKKLTKELMGKPYSDKLVYCIYNECDNGAWFGETKQTSDENNEFGVYGEYNTVGRDNFNSAWKQTYDLIKSINPKALIGGPGFCDYDSSEIEYFMSYCKKNDCLPDIMIYHELGDGSVYYWQDHVKDYRSMEKTLGLDSIPIIVTEYGRMEDNGYPGRMVQYITQIESSKVYANNAYWRLANNLNDVCADDNSPNSNWWLMRWYTDMEGQTVKGEYKDIFSSDFKKSIQQHKKLNYKGFMGIASITDNEDRIDIICGGADKKANIVLQNLDKTKLKDKKVEITIEQTVYKGLYGIVNEPVTIKKYTADINSDKLVIEMKELDEANAYHIVITQADESAVSAYDNENLPERYEFENGELLGKAYTYDSYCPTSGESEGMVGGIEKKGDGVEITVDILQDGEYFLDLIYGNSNDGEADENGRQNPSDRKYTKAVLSIDDNENEINLANTIKSEYTSCYSLKQNLKKGKHKIRLTHSQGTYVLDSLVVTPFENQSVCVLDDSDRTTKDNKSFLAVSPADGYYSITLSGNSLSLNIDGCDVKTNEIGAVTAYLRKGLNYIDVKTSDDITLSISKSEDENISSVALSPDKAKLTGTAKLKTNSFKVKYIDSIDCKSGSAEYKFNAAKAGPYRITMSYSNNDEGGVHDYNVDLIERYVTVTANGKSQNIYCRNTYSWDTFKTVTFNVNLKKGANTIVLSNNGLNKFNSKDTAAPYISNITVNPAQQ